MWSSNALQQACGELTVKQKPLYQHNACCSTQQKCQTFKPVSGQAIAQGKSVLNASHVVHSTAQLSTAQHKGFKPKSQPWILQDMNNLSMTPSLLYAYCIGVAHLHPQPCCAGRSPAQKLYTQTLTLIPVVQGAAQHRPDCGASD